MLGRASSSRAALVWITLFSSSVGNAQDDDPPLMVETYPEYLVYTRQGMLDNPMPGQIVAVQKKWDTGRTLRVCFFGGNPVVRHLIAASAVQWSGPANLKFDFGSQPNYRRCLDPDGISDIRIGFNQPGYWSYVGTESLDQADPYQPTMNFEGFQRRYTESKFTQSNVLANANPYDKAVILHEFGHAIAFEHEHQHPDLRCWDRVRWNGPNNVYEYLGNPPNGWSPEMVDFNLKPLKFREIESILPPDRESIMFYSLPASIFTEGAQSQCYVSPPVNLSARDREAAGKLYPAGGTVILADNETGVPARAYAVPSASAAPGTHENYRSKLMADLESSDAFARRDARGRLAAYFEEAPQSEIQAIINPITTKAYRYQLGVAVALEKSEVDLSPSALSRLNQLEAATSDTTLKHALARVTDR